jgi:hypothetical protein
MALNLAPTRGVDLGPPRSRIALAKTGRIVGAPDVEFRRIAGRPDPRPSVRPRSGVEPSLPALPSRTGDPSSV